MDWMWVGRRRNKDDHHVFSLSGEHHSFIKMEKTGRESFHWFVKTCGRRRNKNSTSAILNGTGLGT